MGFANLNKMKVPGPHSPGSVEKSGLAMLDYELLSTLPDRHWSIDTMHINH